MTASTASPSPASLPTTQDVSVALWGELATLDELVTDGKQRQARPGRAGGLDHADGPDRAELADMITSLEQARDADSAAPAARRPAPRRAARRGLEVRHTHPGRGPAGPTTAPQPPRPTWASRGPRRSSRAAGTSRSGAERRPPGSLVAIVPLNGGPCLHCRL